MSEYKNYREKFKAQIDEWEAELDVLKAKARKKAVDFKIEHQKEINELEKRIEKGKVKLRELSEKGEEAWESMRKNLEETFDSLSERFNEFRSKF